MSPAEKRVCVGVVTGAHGVRGAVRLKSFTAEAADIAHYGPLEDEAGERQFRLRLVGTAKGVVIAKLAGVADRDQAEQLRGLRLYLSRAALPPPADDEYYHADLIGLPCEDEAGNALGTVAAVENFGAGDLLEIERANGKRALIPFKPGIADLGDGKIVADPAFLA